MVNYINCIRRRLPCGGQRPSVGKRRRQRGGHRRRPADGAGWVRLQPHVDAVDVEHVAAVRQEAEHVGGLVIRQANRAAGRRQRHPPLPRLRVRDLRVTPQRRLVESPGTLHPRRRRLLLSPTPTPLRRGRRGGRGSTHAEEGDEGDGGDEEEDAGGDAEAVNQTAEPLRRRRRAAIRVRIRADGIVAAHEDPRSNAIL